MRHRTRSGGRQPAVGVSNAIAIADAFVRRPASAACRSETTFATATRWISAFRDRIPSTSHGGLTPPALGAVRTFAGEKTICAMHERTFAGAAGVSPPCYGEPNAVLQESRTVQRLCDTEPRAADMSPPWVCTRWSVAHGVRQITCKHVSRTTGGLTPPALVSGCECLPAKKTIFAMRERTFTRAAGVSPPWFGKGPRLQCTLTDA
jgi:hypothetical protein